MIEDYISEMFDVEIPRDFSVERELERLIDYAAAYGYKNEKLKRDIKFFLCNCRKCDFYNFIYKECSKEKCEKKQSHCRELALL